MAKLTLNDIVSGYGTAALYNANNTLIETALENTLSRDGTSPNTMSANLDMNSNKVVNLAQPTLANDAARLIDVQATSATSLPVQTGHANKFLKSDGTVATWNIPAASEVSNTPAGTIAATTVQAAINELASDATTDATNLSNHILDLSNTSNTLLGDNLIGFKQSNASVVLTGAVARTVHNKLQEYVSVKDFGATGDGVTDDTSFIQAALSSGTPTIFFPAGTYLISSTLNMVSGQSIVGASCGNYTEAGATLKATTAIAYVTLPNNAIKCSIKNIRFLGTNPYTAGSIGIDIGDHTAAKTMTDIVFEDIYFLRLDIAIKADAVGSQISQVTVKQCQSIETNKFIYINGQDCDGWNIDTCNGNFKTAFMYCDAAGYIKLYNCAGYGYAAGAAFIYLNSGSREPLLVEECQCEATDFFLRQISGTLASITLFNCIVNSTVQLEADCVLVLNGCTITAPVKLADPTGGNGYLLDINNHWLNVTYPTAMPVLASNSQISAEIGTRYESDQNTTARLTVNRGAINATLFPTYGTTISIEPNRGDFINIVATNGTAFTISNPTLRGSAWPSYAYTGGAEITICIKNTSGAALGAITWDTKYKMTAWTSPATGYNRSIVFKFDGTNWIEVYRSSADIPN